MYYCRPAHAFVALIYVVQATKRHSHYKQLRPWKTLFSSCGLFLLFWRLQPPLCMGRRDCALAHFRHGPWSELKVLMKVVSVNSSSFVQSMRQCSQDLFCGPSCGVVTPSWQMLMNNCEAEHLQSAQPEGCLSLAWGDGTANLAEKLFLLAALLIESLADRAVLVQVQLWRYCGVEISLVSLLKKFWTFSRFSLTHPITSLTSSPLVSALLCKPMSEPAHTVHPNHRRLLAPPGTTLEYTKEVRHLLFWSIFPLYFLCFTLGLCWYN